MNRVYGLVLSFFMLTAEANIDIESFSSSQLKLSETERVKVKLVQGETGGDEEAVGGEFDPFSQFKSDYRSMLSSIRVPPIKAAPKLTYDISITDGFVDYQRRITPVEISKSNLPFSDLYKSKSLDDKKEAHLVYKCDAQKKKAINLSNSLSISSNLSLFVDGMVENIGNAENEIKASISKQVSGFFQNISRLLSPGYITEQIIKIFATNLAEATCKVCEETKVGCSNVFLFAEAAKTLTVNEKMRELGMGAEGRVTIRETQHGPILEADTGTKCPSGFSLEVFSGLSVGSGTHTKDMTTTKKKTIIGLTGDEVLDAAKNTCRITEYKAILDVIKTAIDVARGSLGAIIETQQSCREENSNKITLYEKSNYSKENSSNFFKKINNFIETKVNEPGQNITSTVMDNIDSAIKVMNKSQADTDIGEGISKAIKLREKTLSTSLSQLDKYDFIMAKINNSTSPTIFKDISRVMMNDVFVASQYSVIGKKNFSKLIECDSEKMKVEDMEIDCIPGTKKATIADKNKIYQLQEDFYTDLDFYNKVFMDNLVLGVPNNSSLLCNKFRETEYEKLNMCYRYSYLEHLTGIGIESFLPEEADISCECNGYGMLLDLIPNPFNTSRVLLNAQALGKKSTASSKNPGAGYLDHLNSGLNQLRRAFVINMATYVSNIQSRQNKNLYQLGLTSQYEIKKLIKEYFELMRK